MQTVAHEGNSALPLRMSYPDRYKGGMMNIYSLPCFALECLLKSGNFYGLMHQLTNSPRRSLTVPYNSFEEA